MLTDDHIHAWVCEHGPWLYWALNNPRLWPRVLRDGLLPRAATGQAGLALQMPSRVGHVYLMVESTARAREAGGAVAEAQVRVDIRNLNPALLDTDEDRVSVRTCPAARSLPRFAALPEQPTEDKLAAWMDEHADIVDQPDWEPVA